MVVKCHNAAGLGLALGLGVDNLARPQGVVGNDEATIVEIVHDQVIILDILALVSVDKDEVETRIELRHDVACVADVERHALAVGRQCQMLTDEIFLLVVDFDGVHTAVIVGQPLGKA